MTATTGSGDHGGTTADRISYDDCFDLLSNHRRRYTLHYLKQSGDEATLGELSDQIAAWENEIEPSEISYDERKRVYTSLQQVHLPRMDDMGVVEFDDREGTVTVGPVADELDIYLEMVQGRDVPWSTFYLGLSAVNLSVVAAATAGVPLLGALSGTALAVFVAISFLVVVAAHNYIARTEMLLGEHHDPPELRR